MSAQPQHDGGLTYDEIRGWAIELGLFTATDLAHAMGVDRAIATYAIVALLEDNICVNTGDEIDGPSGYEYIIEYASMPPGPTRHDSGPDPVQRTIAQYKPIAVQRGTPVRIRNEGKMRRTLSTPGARQRHKNREREYQRQQAVKEERAERQSAKAKQQQQKRKK